MCVHTSITAVHVYTGSIIYCTVPVHSTRHVQQCYGTGSTVVHVCILVYRY